MIDNTERTAAAIEARRAAAAARREHAAATWLREQGWKVEPPEGFEPPPAGDRPIVSIRLTTQPHRINA